ncbi:peptidase S8 and S53 subtilisin kexin sedolisin [Aspergillus oryzae]|uniref:Peptidase S8 and S53 subtilisin kexin sedolisin n=3 Tax=Aspergillus oryzae TaxID=5062 RepID=A0A1S9DBV6_ASPOZ|nr:peptidase S8 and S53 subtilisin kexin sedolisin [Aspergillus oryzae]
MWSSANQPVLGKEVHLLLVVDPTTDLVSQSELPTDQVRHPACASVWSANSPQNPTVIISGSSSWTKVSADDTVTSNDTIFTAAPSARDVYLYSSVNTAVLRGWASESGLCKLTKLQRLTIEVHPKDGNDEKDCQEFAVEFIKTVSSRCKTLDPSNIKMIYPSDHPNQESNNLEIQRNRPKDDSIPSHGQPKPDAWILKLQPLKEFIRPILRSTGGLSARVALLDDGAKLTGKYGKQKGQSFHPDKEEYFVGPCIHGTKMADYIRQLCPEVELLIARLDDSRKVESGQRFTTASAYKDENETGFSDLITKNSKKVIFSGSLMDKGPEAEVKDYAPVGIDGVIKIGSATLYGQQAERNLYAQTDFLLPGEDVQMRNGNKASGSSFSTAYAAGLAALVLSCLRAHMGMNDPEPYTSDSKDPEEERARHLFQAKSSDGMKSIFEVLSQRPSNDKCAFITPSRIFGDKYSDSKEERLKAHKEYRRQPVAAKSSD